MRLGMTEDELRRFEKTNYITANEEKPESGPASESEVIGTEEQPRPPSGDPEIPPINPD